MATVGDKGLKVTQLCTIRVGQGWLVFNGCDEAVGSRLIASLHMHQHLHTIEKCHDTPPWPWLREVSSQPASKRLLERLRPANCFAATWLYTIALNIRCYRSLSWSTHLLQMKRSINMQNRNDTLHKRTSSTQTMTSRMTNNLAMSLTKTQHDQH